MHVINHLLFLFSIVSLSCASSVTKESGSTQIGDVRDTERGEEGQQERQSDITGYSLNVELLPESEYGRLLVKEDVVEKTSGHMQGTKMKGRVYAFSEKPDPNTLLRFLAQNDGAIFLDGIDGNGNPPRLNVNENWVTKKDVSKLIEHIRSKQIASMVLSPVTSNMPWGYTSTVGIEAMAMVASFRGKKYPGQWMTGVDFCPLEEQDKLADEYIKWWESVKDLPEDQIPKDLAPKKAEAKEPPTRIIGVPESAQPDVRRE